MSLVPDPNRIRTALNIWKMQQNQRFTKDWKSPPSLAPALTACRQSFSDGTSYGVNKRKETGLSFEDRSHSSFSVLILALKKKSKTE